MGVVGFTGVGEIAWPVGVGSVVGVGGAVGVGDAVGVAGDAGVSAAFDES